MARGGADLIKILSYKDGTVSDIYETDKSSIDDPALFKGEKFYFNEAENKSRVWAVKFEVENGGNGVHLADGINIEDAKKNTINDLNKIGVNVTKIFWVRPHESNTFYESAQRPEDVLTVDDLNEVLARTCDNDDKVMFRVNKQECSLFDIHSKGGIAVIDLVKGKFMHESITDEQWEEAAHWFAENGYDIHDSDEGGFTFTQEVEGKRWYDQDEGWNLYLKLSGKEKNTDMNEGYGWRRGRYGGSGRSFSSLGDRAPRGAAIGWYAVDVLDPKAKGNIAPGWRCGPSNFKFTDLLYPERNYKVGTMVMRNKYVKAGSMSGEKYIAIPSYFDAIKNNDEEALNILKLLGIPLNLTFGMNPDDDYSVTYN